MLVPGILASELIDPNTGQPVAGGVPADTGNILAYEDPSGNISEQLLTFGSGHNIKYVDPPLPITISSDRVPTNTAYGEYLSDSQVRVIGADATRNVQFMSDVPLRGVPRFYVEAKAELSPGSATPSWPDQSDVYIGIATKSQRLNYFRDDDISNDWTAIRDATTYNTGVTQNDLGVLIASIGTYRIAGNSPDETGIPTISGSSIIDTTRGSVFMAAFDIENGRVNIGANGAWRQELLGLNIYDNEDFSYTAPGFYEWQTAAALDAEWFFFIFCAHPGPRQDPNVSYDITIYGGSRPFNYTPPAGYTAGF